MATIQFKNNASTTLSGTITNVALTMVVVSSSGFPAVTTASGNYFYATMYELSGSPAVEINVEIVKVTDVTGTTWTMARAQDGTSAYARSGTTYIEHRMTAAAAQSFLQSQNNLSDVGSATTARTNLGLQSMATQRSDAVAITGGTISGVTLTSLYSATTFEDNVDTNKAFRFEASGIATGNTRVLTVPNANGTIALTSDLTSGYQPLDSDLTAVAGLAATGLIARTGSGTAASRALTQPAAGITVTNGDGVSGNPTIALANDLSALEGLASVGIAARTAADTWAQRTITGTSNEITVTNGDGVAGNPTLSLPSALTFTGKTITGGTFNGAVNGTVGATTPSTVAATTMSASGVITSTLATGSGAPFVVASTARVANLNVTNSAAADAATTATNISSGVLGSVPYQSAAGTTGFIAPNTSASIQFLTQTGTGTVGALPAWTTLTKTHVGLSAVENTALSTWAGTANITAVGTIASGTWNATAIADGKIASALTGKTYNGLGVTVATNTGTLTAGTSALVFNTSGTIGSAAFTASSAYQAASANLTGWSSLTPSSKQDASANLTSWSALAPSTKQNTLVSGTNIRTINGNSLLGSSAITLPDFNTTNTFTKNQYCHITAPENGMYIGMSAMAEQTSGTEPVVPGFFIGYSKGGTGTVWGIATEADTGDNTTAGTSSANLVGAELAVMSQYPSNSSTLAGVNVVFKTRPDSLVGGAVRAGLGSNNYNLNSYGVWITAQARSTAGEYCGWSRGVMFDANSLDSTTAGKAIAFDASAVSLTKANILKFPDGGLQNVSLGYACGLTRTASLALTNNDTTLIKFDGGSDPWSMNNSTTGEITIPVTGLYHVTAQFNCTAPSVATLITGIYIFKNGTIYRGGPFTRHYVPSGTPSAGASFSSVMQLTAGDKLTVYAYLAANGAGALDVTFPFTFANVVKVG